MFSVLRRLLIIPVFLLITPQIGQGYAESLSGTIEGRVFDNASDEALPGATLIIDGTAIGVTTNSDGSYRLDQVPNGAQTLIVSYVGYKTKRIPIQMEDGTTLTENIGLDLDVVAGQEVTVTAQAEGQIAAINEQLASNTIINVVSASRIQELPDANAAESVGRLPGVSLKRSAGEGNKVVIRGLSPKYNTVTVNGQQLPGTSDDRSSDLSLISSDLLAGIELTKAHTSDQDGDYLGGSVNFKVAEAPKGFRNDIRLQGGYNNQQSAFGQFKGNLTTSNRFMNEKLGVIVQANAENVNRGSDVLSASYNRLGDAPDGELAPLLITGLNLTDRLEDRSRYGASLLLDYKLPNGKIKFTNFFSRLDRDVTSYNKNYGVSARIVNYGIRDQDITTDLFSTVLGGEQQLGQLKMDWSLSRGITTGRTPYDNQYRFAERNGFESSELVFNQGPALIPGAARNNIIETAFDGANFRTNREQERDLSAQLNLEAPYSIGSNIAGNLSFGGKIRSKKRLNDESGSNIPFTFGPGVDFLVDAFPDIEFTYASQGFLSLEKFLDPGYDTGEFLDGSYDFGFAPDLDLVTKAWERLEDVYFRSSLAEFRDYDNVETVSAAYAMTEINVGRWLMIMPGFRYEKTDTEYTASQGRVANSRQTDAVRTDTTEFRDYDHLLPMLHLRIKPTTWFDIRLARTETISRPNHLDFSPRLIIEGSNQNVTRGNPNLRPSEAVNYDAFFSFKGNKLGLFTVGLFKKDIEGLIFTRRGPAFNPEEFGLPADTRGFLVTEPVNNEGTTDVNGWEVDWQANLTFLRPPFNGLVFNANFARINSETQYPVVLLERNPSGFGFVRVDTFRVGNMIDQAKQIANFSLGYDQGGFSGRVSMLVQGESLTGISAAPELDRFTGNYVRWDLSLKQNLTSQASIYLNANNFNDRPDESFQVIEGFPTAQEFYGWTVDIGVRYRY